jgi:hypothetical protein
MTLLTGKRLDLSGKNCTAISHAHTGSPGQFRRSDGLSAEVIPEDSIATLLPACRSIREAMAISPFPDTYPAIGTLLSQTQ